MSFENNKKPVFSLILPLAAGAVSLSDTIESVLRQAFKDFELIIMNASSPSPVLSHEQAKAAEDSRVRVLTAESSMSSGRQEGGNVSPVSCRNAGLLAASGDYILYISSGDLLLPHALGTIYDRAIAPRHPDIVLFGLISADSEEDVVASSYPAGFYKRETLEKGVFPYMICDRRKKFYSACFPPSLHNRAISRRLLLRHYCREVRIVREEAHSFIHECLYFADSAYLIEDPLYILSGLSRPNDFDPSFFESNRLLYDYLNERLGKYAVLSGQLPLLKTHLLEKAVSNAALHPDGPAAAVSFIEAAVSDTFALSDIKKTDLPLHERGFVSLLKSGHYGMAMRMVKK